MKKLVWHCPYLGLEHLCLIKMGWKEGHCVMVENDTWIRMEFWIKIVDTWAGGKR